MTHRYAEMLGWLQAGQQILGKWRGGAEGHFPVSFNSREVAYAVDGAEGWEFRLKPRTVKIGSREVEAPVLEPGDLKMVWCWDSDFNKPEEQYADGDVAEPQFKLGLCFATEEACQAAHDAIHALLRGEA